MSQQGNGPSGNGFPIDQKQRDAMGRRNDNALSGSNNNAADLGSLDKGPVSLREDLIDKAVGFLTHPKVQDTPLSRKREFLREKKGLTEAEIDEAIKRAGVVGSQVSSSYQNQQRALPMQSLAPPAAAVPQEKGYGWATVLGAVVAAGATAVTGYYAYQNWAEQRAAQAKAQKKQKKKKADSYTASTPASLSKSGKKKSSVQSALEELSDAEENASKSVKKSASSKKKSSRAEDLDDGETEEEETKAIRRIIQAALETQAAENTQRMLEVEKLLRQIEENNKQKYELMKQSSATPSSSGGGAGGGASSVVEDSALRNDIQTIKQLLLTRQMAATVAPTPIPVVATIPTPSTPTTTASAPLTGSSSSPTSTTGDALGPKEKEEEESLPLASSAVSVAPPATPTTPAMVDVPNLVHSSSTSGLKPWEQRRRVRIENAAATSAEPSTPTPTQEEEKKN